MLTVNRQSGGERSVSTMMYLISIQVGRTFNTRIIWLREDLVGLESHSGCDVPQPPWLCPKQATHLRYGCSARWGGCTSSWCD